MAENSAAGGGGEFMLFGVRVVVDQSMRKSVSVNSLSQSNNNNDTALVDYASTAAIHHHCAAPTVNCERKRGVAWTEEEHKRFLVGLHKVGKGDWRGISRNFVKTRTPTQVASHAQKYFLRRNTHNRGRRRSSLFDITTDSVVTSNHQMIIKESINQSGATLMAMQPNFEEPNAKFTLSPSPIYTPMAATTSMVNTNTSSGSSSSNSSPLSLNLSLSISTEAAKSTLPMNSGFQLMEGFRNPDDMLTVA